MIQNLQFIRELPSPQAVRALLPVPEECKPLKQARDNAARDIFAGKDDRFVLIIGPCSADRQDAVLEYSTRLARLQERVQDKLYIIPRIYTNKPRSTADGYKGMLHQPDPEEESDMLRGLLAIRKLHLKILAETGFTSADEMLYPENHAYLEDVLGYVAVGARSVEDQQHRLTASGLAVPVGMKNPTSGDYAVMLNAILTAQHSHTFVYRGWEVASRGNPYAHAILRGYVDKLGRSRSNYHLEALQRLHAMYAEKQVENMAVIIDCNHSNSGKQYLEQIRITREVLHSRRNSPEIRNMVKGIMVESYLEDGAQKIGEGVYGKSITDPCLGWEKTERLILEMADQL